MVASATASTGQLTATTIPDAGLDCPTASGPVDNECPHMAGDPGHTPEFNHIIATAHLGDANVKSYRDLVDALMRVRDDELVMLGQVRAMSHVSIWPEALSAEVARRSTVALVEFRVESATASGRLLTLTRWLIVFTCAVVLLTVVLVVHDLTR